MNYSQAQLQFLNSHPNWMLLSWEVRGMAISLMAHGDFDSYLGTLPPEDDLWRNILGFPTTHAISLAMKKTVSGRGVREFREMDTAWKEVWRVELEKWFMKIDEDFIAKNPKFSKCLGRYWHPLLSKFNEKPNPVRYLNDEELIESLGKKTKPRSKTRKSKPKVKTFIDLNWDYPEIRYTSKTIRNCWEEALDSEARTNLWDSAINLIAIPNDIKSEREARKFLGLLIKEFGEKNVATAVAQMAIRPTKPVEPKSFLRSQLRYITKGTLAEQKARNQRGKIPL